MAENEVDAKNCGKCREDFKEDKIIGCEGKCNQWFHIKCVKVKDKQFAVLKEFKGVKWYCEQCYVECEVINKVLTFLDSKLNTVMQGFNNEVASIKEMVKEIMDVKQQTWAQKVNITKKVNPQVVVIKPKDIQESSKTFSEVQKKVRPPELQVGITSVRNIRDGGIIVGCSKEEDARKVEQCVNKELSEKYNIQRPIPKIPQIKIVGMSEKLTGEEISSFILAQNEIIDKNTAKVEIKRVYESKGNFTAIADVDPSTFHVATEQGKLIVDWDRCAVYEHVDLLRCFKCAGFFHKAEHCNKEDKCGNCSGNHRRKDCNEEVFKCVNCKHANETLKMTFDIKHSAYDLNCPVYKRHIERQRNKVNYAEQQK